MIANDIIKILKDIYMVFFDFDGVFTNNLVIISDKGEESVICTRSDGLGLSMLRSIGISMAILSTEINPVVKMRSNKLQIDCLQGFSDKLYILKKIAKKKRISLKHIAYVGNDINDISCLKAVGLPIAVADAYPEVKNVSKIILTKNGGYGAVREFCEILYKTKLKK